jgi:hypothetical protein
VLTLAGKAENDRLESPQDPVEFFERQGSGGMPRIMAVPTLSGTLNFAARPIVTYQLQTETTSCLLIPTNQMKAAARFSSSTILTTRGCS